jgi:hypothetical protein
MNKIDDLYDIFNYMPIGYKLYSPKYGDVYFRGFGANHCSEWIIVKFYDNYSEKTANFNFDGSLYDGSLDECENEDEFFLLRNEIGDDCMLFPSKDKMTWDDFEVEKAKDAYIPTIFYTDSNHCFETKTMRK